MKTFLSIVLCGCALTMALGQSQSADNPVTKKNQTLAVVPADEQKLDAILEELKQIRQLLADQNKYMTQRAASQVPAPAPVIEKISLTIGEKWYSLGSNNAPVTMMEFADFQCPYCRRFHAESFAELKRNYIDTGKVRFISRDLPLDFHANSMIAAEAARCAGDQNKYWELRDSLIVNAKDLARESITKYAEQVGLDMAGFATCLDGQKYKSQVERDRNEANKLGFSGTPSFVIGRTKDDKLDGVKIVGALPYAIFDTKINELLLHEP